MKPTKALSLARICLLSLGLGCAQLAPAASVLQSFNDIADVALVNGLILHQLDVPGGVGFTSGYQQTGTGVPVIRTNDLTVSLANYVSGQETSTQHWSVAAVTTSSGYARRAQTRGTPAISGTIWFSFLASLRTPVGETALTFNGGWNNSGVATANGGGMRVGLGGTEVAVRGAFGVGPLASSTAEVGLNYITNGVNGAITSAGFIPTNATAGLVLGRIDTEPNFGYPRVSLWYNPNVPNAASLPAPTVEFIDTNFVFVTTTVTRIGYQVSRSATAGVQNEVIDNVKVSDEPTAFDIVYKNAALPTPILRVSSALATNSESGPGSLTFSISADKILAAPLTISYQLTGAATNGYDFAGGFAGADYTDPNFDMGTLLGVVTIPAGSSNANVTLALINDTLPEGNESVILTVQPSASYIIGAGNPSTGIILDDNDANVSLQYMFTRTPLAQVWDTNMVAAPAVTTGIGNGAYSGVYYISPDAACSASGDQTAADAATAILNNDYLGLTISPVPGRALTLTNLEFQAVYANHLFQVPEAASATVFVRSSVDNFTANIAEFALQADNLIFPNIWYSNYVALGPEFSNLPGSIEFRLYIYDDSPHNQVCVRIDNLYFSGITAALPPTLGQVATTTNVVNAVEPATPGQFQLVRYGDVSQALAVNYTLTGTAVSGTDYVPPSGTAAFAAGESNAVVTVVPIDDELPEAAETIILNLQPGVGYGVLPPVSTTLNLLDDGDVGGLVAYFLNENNNTAGSLAAIARPSIKLTNSVSALNMAAGAGMGPFGPFNGGGQHGYGSSVFRSSPSTLYVGNSVLGTSAAGAVTNNDYLSVTLAPRESFAMNLTNLTAWLMMRPEGGQTNWVLLRSSLDNFTADLGTMVIAGTTNNSPEPFLLNSLPLNVAAYPGAVEFRFYVYSTRSGSGDLFRLDDLTFHGNTVAAPPGTRVITVAATDPTASEPGADTGAFTLTRAGDSSGAVSVPYTVSGTASNGVDYALLSGTANFAAGQTSLVIPVTPIDDNRPEPTETVTLSLQTGPDYFLGLVSSATVDLLDDADNTPLFALTADTNAYERVSSLMGFVTLNRTLGNLSNTVTLNFTLGGSAVLGVDYLLSATNSVTFAPGVTTQTIQVIPIDNLIKDGDRTVVLNIQSAPDFILDPPLSTLVSIVDDELGTETVLWLDNFDGGTSAANYTIRSASELGYDDYTADFAFDYSSLGLAAPAGSTNNLGLMVNANLTGTPAGVNFYPTSQTVTGDFALRFSLYLSYDAAGGQENEAAYFGINQTGLATNWLAAFGGVYTNHGEGIWVSLGTRDGTPGIASLRASTNTGGAPVLIGATGNFPSYFNSPPYGQAGRPNNRSDSTNKTWVECELNQVGGVITLKLNNAIALQYTNATPFTGGNVFVGYGDPFATIGTANCYAIFDNVRVVRLEAPAAQPVITGITLSGGTVEIRFSAGPADVASAFKLQHSATPDAGFADENSATIVATGSGQFKATTATSGNSHFYRIRR